LSAQLVVVSSSILSIFAALNGNSVQPYPLNKSNRFYLENPLYLYYS